MLKCKVQSLKSKFDYFNFNLGTETLKIDIQRIIYIPDRLTAGKPE